MLWKEMDASLQERWLYNLRLLKRGYRVGNHRTRKKTWMITAGPDRVGSSSSESRTWPAPDGRRGEDGDDDIGEEERAGRRPQRAEAVSPGSLGLRSRGIRSKINQSRRRPQVTTPKSKSPFLHHSLSLSPRAARSELAGVWPRDDLARWVRGVGWRLQEAERRFSLLRECPPLRRPHRRPRWP